MANFKQGEILMKLKLKNISKKYNNKLILDNISLEIKSQEILAILGSNGVGKTTLLKSILGIIPSSGEIFLDDIDLKNIRLEKKAKYISYVPQHININFSISVIDYILMGRNIYNESKSYKLKLAQDIIKKLELEEIALSNMNNLSGGQFQKVLIARALIQDAKIIILDEPTSALDIKHQKKVLEILNEFAREKDLIIIMTLHDLPLANKYCNKFLFLKDKKIFAYGNSNILTKKIIEEIYETNVDIINFNGEKKILIV